MALTFPMNRPCYDGLPEFQPLTKLGEFGQFAETYVAASPCE